VNGGWWVCLYDFPYTSTHRFQVSYRTDFPSTGTIHNFFSWGLKRFKKRQGKKEAQPVLVIWQSAVPTVYDITDNQTYPMILLFGYTVLVNREGARSPTFRHPDDVPNPVVFILRGWDNNITVLSPLFPW